MRFFHDELAPDEADDLHGTPLGDLLAGGGFCEIGHILPPDVETHLAEIVRRHLDDICKLASDLGVPREKLFTHVGGWKEGELLYDTALNRYSCPGWSFYRHAGDAAKDIGVQRVLQRSDAPYWGAVEWLLMGKHSTREWEDALVRTLSIPKCRYVCIYNWNGIRDDPAAVQGIERVLDMPGRES